MCITFIIPSVNRPTLAHTLRSLVAQTNPEWYAIVVFDGVSPESALSSSLEPDPRIKFVHIKKTGYRNCAGKVRNYGIRLAQTEWIAFVDDDDVLDINYVEYFYQEKDKGDCIIFRMIDKNKNVFPPLNVEDPDELEVGMVGISFAYKKDLYLQGYKFGSSGIEDFNLINDFRQNNINIYISNHIVYVVDPSDSKRYRRQQEIMNFCKVVFVLLIFGLLLYSLVKRKRYIDSQPKENL